MDRQYVKSESSMNHVNSKCTLDQFRSLHTNDNDFISNNGHLAGKSNPKTSKQIKLVDPIYSQQWQHNKLHKPSHINSYSQTDMYLSGYESIEDYPFNCNPKVININDDTHEQIDDIIVNTKTNIKERYKPHQTHTSNSDKTIKSNLHK